MKNASIKSIQKLKGLDTKSNLKHSKLKASQMKKLFLKLLRKTKEIFLMQLNILKMLLQRKKKDKNKKEKWNLNPKNATRNARLTKKIFDFLLIRIKEKMKDLNKEEFKNIKRMLNSSLNSLNLMIKWNLLVLKIPIKLLEHWRKTMEIKKKLLLIWNTNKFLKQLNFVKDFQRAKSKNFILTAIIASIWRKLSSSKQSKEILKKSK